MYKSRAEQKRELDRLNRRFEKITNQIQNTILEARDSTNDTPDLYWELPHNLHQWSKKKSEMFSGSFPEEVAEIETLLTMREEIKAAPVCKPQPENKIEKEIAKEIKDMLAVTRQQYARGIKLEKFFGGLQVTCSAHWVVNQQGTAFVRVFYYLFGSLTALNTIIAVAQEAERTKQQHGG